MKMKIEENDSLREDKSFIQKGKHLTFHSYREEIVAIT